MSEITVLAHHVSKGAYISKEEDVLLNFIGYSFSYYQRESNQESKSDAISISIC